MLTKPIPKDLRDELSLDLFMLKCCLCQASFSQRKIEWHHHFKYKGQRVNRYWCILPVCEECHDEADNSIIKERLDLIMIRRATDDDLEEFPKVDWEQKKKYLENKYAINDSKR